MTRTTRPAPKSLCESPCTSPRTRPSWFLRRAADAAILAAGLALALPLIVPFA